MYDLKIIRNYATALFENATNSKEQDAFLKQLKSLVKVSGKGTELYSIMCSPVISKSIKIKGVDLLASKLTLDKKIISFVNILLSNSRYMMIDEILEHFTKLYNNSHELKHAVVFSAKKLTSKENDIIEKFLNDEIGMSVNIENKIDDKLLGGVVIHYDSTMIDCSLKGALEKIERITQKEY